MIKSFLEKHFGGIPSLQSFKWLIRVNPTSPNSFPTAEEYRKVAPGSQPEYHMEKVEKLAKNQYYTRDTRRQFPQTMIVKQVLSLPGTATPPVMKQRYQYSPSAPHLDATGSAENPEFCIRAVK
jgi:hypothetical protein